MEYEISSPANDRVKRLVTLRDRKHRDRERLFPVEERRIVERAASTGHRPVEVYWCPDLMEYPPTSDVTPVSISFDALRRASYRSSPEGSISLFSYLPTGLDRVQNEPGSLLLIAEGLEKPGNLGAMLRVADAAGVVALIVVDGKVDPFNPNVVRASTGAVFTVPLVTTSMAAVKTWLKDGRFKSVAGLAGSGNLLWDVDLSGRLAIWVGSEAPGLSTEALGFADELVSIPMNGATDSLNVSVSAGVLIFEAVRQRRP